MFLNILKIPFLHQGMGCLHYESFSESDSVAESQQLLVYELDQLKQLISKMVQNDGSESVN